METVQAEAHRIDVAGAERAGAGRSVSDNVHSLAAVVILAGVQQRDAVVSLNIPPEVVLGAVVVPGTAGSAAQLGEHLGVHQQHGGRAVQNGQERVQLVQECVVVAGQLGRRGDAHLAGDLVGGAGKQLFETVKRVGHIAGAAGCGNAVDNKVVEVVGRRLDLLFGLKCQLVYRAGGVLEDTVDLKAAAHDDGVGGFLLALGLAGSVLFVDGTHSSGAGGLELHISVCQGAAAGAGGNRIVKGHPVQQQRAAPEHVNDLLVDLVGHADLCFLKCNRHKLNHPFVLYISLSAPAREVGSPAGGRVVPVPEA